MAPLTPLKIEGFPHGYIRPLFAIFSPCFTDPLHGFMTSSSPASGAGNTSPLRLKRCPIAGLSTRVRYAVNTAAIFRRRFSKADFRMNMRNSRGGGAVFDPYRDMPRINRGMVYLGACLIAGIRLAREKQVSKCWKKPISRY